MRTILHSDLNACYASIECLHRPQIRHLPVAVGGDVEKRHGIILAKNQIAKKYGVRTGEALWQAKSKCPELVIVPPNYRLYIRFSRLVRELYGEYTNQQEPFGLDESWLDVTGSVKGDGKTIAEEIRRRVKTELGLTVSIGVSWNKIFAKLGSDYKKPDAVTVISKESYKEILWPLPVSELLYVGRATKVKLERRGIGTIGRLAEADPAFLKGALGKMGVILHEFANGRDASPVRLEKESAEIKSIGNSITLPRDVDCQRDAAVVMSVLSESVGARLRESHLMCRGVQISLRDKELFSFERQLHFQRPTVLTREIFQGAMELLRNNCNFRKPLRSIGVRAIDLLAGDSHLQLSMFGDEEEREKAEKLDFTVDQLRSRFGQQSVRRAVSMLDKGLGDFSPKEDHVIFPVGYFH